MSHKKTKATNKTDKKNAPQTVAAKAILKEFLDRFNSAENTWKGRFNKIRAQVTELCSKSTSDDQFEHYLRELLVFAGFFNEEIQTLVYGLLKSKEMESRDAAMILSNKLGSFDDDGGRNVPDCERKCKLSLCSVEGLKHLRQLGQVFKHFIIYLLHIINNYMAVKLCG